MQFFLNSLGQMGSRLAINPKNLLTDRVCPATKDARFGWRRPASDTKNAGNVEMFAPETADQSVARWVVSNRSDGQHASAERGKIIGGIGAATGNKLRFAMAEDEDRRFAGNARNLAKLKFISDEISQQDNRLGRKLLDTFREGEKIDRGRWRVFLCPGRHSSCLKIQ